jgi:serine/threonine protein kinase
VSGDPRAAPAVPDRFGNYRILDVLGEGGMATVFLAERVPDQERVAIKVIAPHLIRNAHVQARFEAEARAVSRIDHPNVIRVLDYGRLDSGMLFQVMELLEGRELTELLDERYKLSAHEILPYVEQICRGLQAAHDCAVIHRDLKPNNIFILRGEPLTLKLLDFGIAKLIDPEEWVNLTTTGVIIGTPLFISPEQALGDRERIGPWTDLYSLGVILYTMLCGDPPFPFDTVSLLLARHIQEPPPPLRERDPSVPAEVARLVHRCLEKDPGRRPSSARQIAREFAAAVRAAPSLPVSKLSDVFVPPVIEPPTKPLRSAARALPHSGAETVALPPDLPPETTAEAEALPDTAEAALPDTDAHEPDTALEVPALPDTPVTAVNAPALPDTPVTEVDAPALPDTPVTAVEVPVLPDTDIHEPDTALEAPVLRDTVAREPDTIPSQPALLEEPPTVQERPSRPFEPELAGLHAAVPQEPDVVPRDPPQPQGSPWLILTIGSVGILVAAVLVYLIIRTVLG